MRWRNVIKKRPGTLQKIPPLSDHADEQTTGGNSGFDPQLGGLYSFVRKCVDQPAVKNC